MTAFANWAVFSAPSGAGTVILIFIILAAAFAISSIYEMRKRKKSK